MARFAFSRARFSGILLPLVMVLSMAVLLTGCQWIKSKHWMGHQAGPTDVVAVFFSKYQGSKAIVEPVKRSIPESSQTDPLPFAIQELLKGPTKEEKEQGFYTEIPEGTQLLGIHDQQNKVVINLSKQFETGGGSNSMTQRLEELKKTTYATDNQHQLEVFVEGKPLETLGGEGLEVPGSVKREVQ
jgi:spore germination protein GerM